MTIELQRIYFLGIGMYVETTGLVLCLGYLVNVVWNTASLS